MFGYILIRFNKSIYRWELVGDTLRLEAERKKQEYEKNLVVTTIKALLNQASERRWRGTAQKLLIEGKRITGELIAPTAQKVGYALRDLDGALYSYDRIIYEPVRNGNAGQIHNFYYEDSFAPKTVEAEETEAEHENVKF